MSSRIQAKKRKDLMFIFQLRQSNPVFKLIFWDTVYFHNLFKFIDLKTNMTKWTPKKLIQV